MEITTTTVLNRCVHYAWLFHLINELNKIFNTCLFYMFMRVGFSPFWKIIFNDCHESHVTAIGTCVMPDSAPPHKKNN